MIALALVLAAVLALGGVGVDGFGAKGAGGSHGAAVSHVFAIAFRLTVSILSGVDGLTGKRTFARGIGRFLRIAGPVLRRWTRSGYFGRRPEGPPARVLLLACGWIGDTFWASQVAQALRTELGPAALWAATSPRAKHLWYGLVPEERVLLLDHVVSDRKREAMAWPGLFSDASKLREHEFDVVLDLTGNRYSALVSFLARPGRAYGCGGDEFSHLYSELLPSIKPGKHLSLRPWHVAVPLLGAAPSEPVRARPVPSPPFAARELAAFGLHSSTRYAVLAPGAGWGGKRWPVERFTELASSLEGLQLQVVVVGSESERQLCQQVVAGTRRGRVVAGAPLNHVLAVLAHARIIVSNDSGIAHLAAAEGRPTVALFNSTNPAYCRPLGDAVRVLRSGCSNQPEETQHHCHDTPAFECPASCWDGLTVESVLAVCRQQLLA